MIDHGHIVVIDSESNQQQHEQKLQQQHQHKQQYQQQHRQQQQHQTTTATTTTTSSFVNGTNALKSGQLINFRINDDEGNDQETTAIDNGTEQPSTTIPFRSEVDWPDPGWLLLLLLLLLLHADAIGTAVPCCCSCCCCCCCIGWLCLPLKAVVGNGKNSSSLCFLLIAPRHGL